MASRQNSNSIPSRDVIERRLEEHRKTLYQVDGILGLALSVAEQESEDDLEGSLGAARKMLEDLSGDLEPDVLLEAATPAEEAPHG